MAIIRTQAQEFLVLPHAISADQHWRTIFVDTIVFGWLLYFTALAVLTAIYVGIRQKIVRRLDGPHASKVALGDAHSRRFSQIPIGESESATFAPADSFQSGYQAWALGGLLRLFWKIVPVMTQAQMLYLTVEVYFGLGWDATASKFIFVFITSHSILLFLVKYMANFNTFFLYPCSLKNADYIAVQYIDQKRKRKSTSHLLPVHRLGERSDSGRFFEFTCVRYLEEGQSCRFRPAGQLETSGAQVHKTLQNGGLSKKTAAELRFTEGPNQISVKVPSILESLMIEFSEINYIFQTASIWNYMFWTTWNIAFLWLFLVYGCGAWKSLLIIRKNQKQISSMAEVGSEKPEAVLRDGVWINITAKELVLGDIVQISHGSVPADIALLSGSVIVNESMLTGEPMPLQKIALEGSRTDMYNEKADGKKHSLYAGTEVLQSVADRELKNVHSCESAIGVVMKIGGRTAKGQLIRMVLFPSEVRFKLTEQMPYVIAMLAVWALTVWAIISFVSEMSHTDSVFVGISAITQAVNPLMAVSFVLGQGWSAARLREDGEITCLNVARLPIAGKIGTMVFDKTGTITHSGMALSAVLPVAGRELAEEVGSARLNTALAASQGNLLRALASCHTLTTMQDGTLVGNQVEIVTMQALGWKLSAPGEPRSITAPDGGEKLSVLRQLEFDHHRMTSGAVVRTDLGVFAFVKGAYDKISTICLPESLPVDYAAVCDRYAKKCFYVIAMSFKQLSSEDVEMSRDSLEEGLQCCGLVLFKNEMKEDSPAAIQELRSGGINCVICTGDNTTTGISIGKQCGIFSEGARVLLGELGADGQGLAWRDEDEQGKVLQRLPDVEAHAGQFELALNQSSFRWLVKEDAALMAEILPLVKVYGRMKPDDKVNLISLWQNYGIDGTVTGMTGDGGNDCGALRTAHAGLALSESEASIVSPFSTSQGLHDKGYISLAAVPVLIKEGRACLATNLATFQFFIVYNLSMTSSKLLLVCWLDFTYSEWQFVFTDIILAMVMVSCMVQSRPAKKLASRPPSAALLGTNAIVAVSTAMGIYWFTAGCMLALLLYGPGKDFVELAPSALVEVQGYNWAMKGDNHVTACFFLLTSTVCSTAGFMFSYGHVHREPIWRNWKLSLFYMLLVIFLAVLLWTKPSNLSCMFRINCDNAVSRSMNVPFISRAVGGIKISAGNVGGCFAGPQVVNCKSPSGACWVVPPADYANSTPSLGNPAGTTLFAEPPFHTREEKKDYCAKHPYLSGNSESLGNKWCYTLTSEPHNCHPMPERDLGPMVYGCSGPNNCFNDAFKLALTGLLLLCTLAMQIAYKFGVLGLGSDLFLPAKKSPAVCRDESPKIG